MKKNFYHVDTFTGIAGFALAARNVYKEKYRSLAFCEIDKFCQLVIRKNFGEDSKIYDDIRKLKGEQFRNKIDLLTGGFPCQDISIAGLQNGRKGLEGNRSGLFYEMLRVIEESQPPFIIYENSDQLINHVKVIHKLLAELGYINYGKVFTAREFGFPHLRKRYYGLSVTNTLRIGLEEIDTEVRISYEMYKSTICEREKNVSFINRRVGRALQSKTNSKFIRTFDGVSSGLDLHRIKGLGNSIVPQIAMIYIYTIKSLKEKYKI